MNWLSKTILVVLMALNATAIAAPNLTPINITDASVEKISTQAAFVHDPKNDLEIKGILNDGVDWQTIEQPNIVFDLQRSTTWVMFDLTNERVEPANAYLEFNPVFLEYVEVYDEHGRLLDQAGSKIELDHLAGFPTLQVTMEPGLHRYYVKVDSRSSSLALMIRGQAAFNAKRVFDLVTFCLLIGGLLSLVFYHLFLVTTYRSRLYFTYSGFVASCVLFTISFTSYHKYLLPDSLGPIELDFWWSALSAPIALIFMYLFSAELLGLNPKNSKHPRLAKALLIFPIADVVTVAGILVFNDPTWLIMVRLGGVLHFLGLPATGIYIWRKNKQDKTALYYALSWIPFALGVSLIAGWLGGAFPHHDLYAWSVPFGALVQSLLLSFVAGQSLNKLTQEKLRVMDQLEVQIDELAARDRVITSFVSPEVLSELDKGLDPLAYEPKNVYKSVVFLDMRDFTSFSESHSEMDCHSILNEYFDIISEATYRGGGHVNKIIGDAMMIVFDNPEQCLKAIIEMRFNLSQKNRERYQKALHPLKFGMGVSHGMMLSANFGSSHKYDRTLVGDTVNVASRLESITRRFRVDVMCSQEFVDKIPDYKHARPAGYVQLKGRSKKSLVYEIYGHNRPEVIEWKESTREQLFEMIRMELDGKYEDCMELMQKLIDKCPPHTYREGAIMDETLQALMAALEEKMRLLGMPVSSEVNPLIMQQFRKAG